MLKVILGKGNGSQGILCRDLGFRVVKGSPPATQRLH